LQVSGIIMKTTFKTLTNQKTANQKRKKFEAKTGLKWDWYSTGNGVRFTPIVTKDTPYDPQAAHLLLPYITKNYQEFVKLADISNLKLATILRGAKTLVKQGQAVATVNRCGNFAAIRVKQRGEIPPLNPKEQ